MFRTVNRPRAVRAIRAMFPRLIGVRLMKSKWILFVAVTSTVVLSITDASAYNRYGYRRGGGGGYGGGSTVYGSAMMGQAAYTQALGQYQVMNAQANILNQQAFSAYLQNRKNYAQTYFDLKR